MEATVYNTKGKESGTVQIPEPVFSVPWNADLVHQVVVSMQENRRAGTAHTKDRSEVSGGGRKPWKQKGTGRARHGSRRSPIWIHGGVAHGPRNERVYAKKINRRMRAKALAAVLSRKFKEGEILFIDALDISEVKTKDAAAVVSNLAGISGFEVLANKPKNAARLVLPEVTEATEKSFRNIPNIETVTAANLNVLDVLSSKVLVIVDPEQSLEQLVNRMSVRSKERV